MAEPVIAPLAAFGLAMTILNIFLSTIRTMRERWSEIKDYEEMIGDSKRVLFISVKTYGLWLKIWGHSDEQEYDKVFGVSGWDEIKRCKGRIEGLAHKTADLISLKIKPPATIGTASIRTSPRSVYRLKWRRLRVFIFNHSRNTESELRGTTEMAQLDDNRGRATVADEQTWSAFIEHINNEISRRPDGEVVEQSPQAWETLLDRLRSSNLCPSERTIRRIMGVFGRNVNIRTSLSELENAVKGLAELTKVGLAEMGHTFSDVTRRMEAKAIKNTVTFRHVAQELQRAVRAHNDNTRDPDLSQWFLSLRYLNLEEISNDAAALIFDRCDFSFVVKLAKTKAEEVRLRRVQGRLQGPNVGLSPPPKSLKDALREFQSDGSVRVVLPESNDLFMLSATRTPPQLVTKDWLTLLAECDADNQMWKVSKLARARFALDLSCWIILLWETEWFNRLCPCAFRCALFPDFDIFDIEEVGMKDKVRRYRQEHIYAPRSSPGVAAQHQRHHCRNTALNDRLYYFGILLSELVLGRTILLTSDSEPVDDILWEVRSYSVVKDVIDFCFSRSQDEEWQLQQSAQERLSQFIKSVFQPLLKYYEVVDKRFEGDPENHRIFARFVDLPQDHSTKDFQGAVPSL